jgi:xylulokinase
MEGVAFSLKDCYAIIKEQGLKLDQVRVTGGGAKSVLWRQIIADVLGVELVVTNASEGPAFGAALLAGVASGVYSSVQGACAQTIRVSTRTKPRPDVVPVYAQAYETYTALYPALKPIISRAL